MRSQSVMRNISFVFAFQSLLSLVACENRVTCAFKWAQNAEQIFVFVKYAHKLDAPAPNNIKLGDVKINEQSISFQVRANTS